MLGHFLLSFSSSSWAGVAVPLPLAGAAVAADVVAPAAAAALAGTAAAAVAAAFPDDASPQCCDYVGAYGRACSA